MPCLTSPRVPQSRPRRRQAPKRRYAGRNSMTASRYHDIYARWQRDPEGFWGEAAQGHRLVRQAEEGVRQGRRHLRPLVRRRHLQHLLQRARPPRRRRPRPAARADLRFAGHQHPADLHLWPHAVRGADARRDAARLRRQKGRHRHSLYADGAGGGVRDAGLRAHRRHPLGGVRRLRGQGTRHPHRRLQAEADPVGELRHRRRARHSLQTVAG